MGHAAFFSLACLASLALLAPRPAAAAGDERALAVGDAWPPSLSEETVSGPIFDYVRDVPEDWRFKALEGIEDVADLDAPPGAKVSARLKGKLQQLVDGFPRYPALAGARLKVIQAWTPFVGGGAGTAITPLLYEGRAARITCVQHALWVWVCVLGGGTAWRCCGRVGASRGQHCEYDPPTSHMHARAQREEGSCCAACCMAKAVQSLP